MKLEKGFTLIEVLVALSLVSIISILIYEIFISLNFSYTKQTALLTARQEIRAALDVMSQNIRMTGFDPKKTAGAGFEEISEGKIRFTSDRNMNGHIDPSDFEIITYYFNASTKKIMRYLYEGTAAKNSQTLIENIIDFSVKGYDSKGTETANIDEIKTVSISITAGVPAGKKEFVETGMKTVIRARNL